MAEQGDILLYGCNLAGEGAGQEFVESLSQYTAADILASTDLTGSADLGGDWDLEYTVGEIESQVIFEGELADSYEHLFPSSCIDNPGSRDCDDDLFFHSNFGFFVPDFRFFNPRPNRFRGGYNFSDPELNSQIFDFEPNKINFNAVDFDFSSLRLAPDSISFQFEPGKFDAISEELDLPTRVNSPRELRLSFNDFNFNFNSLFSFRSDQITIGANGSSTITFDYNPGSFSFPGGERLNANRNLFDYKFLTGEIALINGDIPFVEYNASDFRALEYAFEGDELFNPEYYLDNYAIPEGSNPFTDYIENGYQAGRNPNGLFDVNYYLEQNPDVRNNGGDPLTHYALFGGGEIFANRDPNPLFDSSYYLANNPDVAAAGVNPLLHYIENGWRESRFDNPGGFNPNRDPSPFFDTSFYFDTYPDVREASFQLESANALQHFLEFGPNGSVAIENRLPHPLFTSEEQLSFSTFVGVDEPGFEFLQNRINTNQFGVRTFRGDDGGVRVASAFDEGGFGLGQLVTGFFYSIFVGGAYILQEASEIEGEGLERIFEADENAETFEKIDIVPAEGTIFTFPGETEGTIVVEEFPSGETITIGEDGTIFSTPLEPIVDFSTTTFPQRDRILEDLLNEPFVFPDEIELPQRFLAIETNPFSAADKNINITLGTLRELKVANQIGGFKVVEPGRPNKDLVVRERNNPRVGLSIDVVGSNNELIIVGGAQKSLDLPDLKDQLTRLKRIANSRNVTAQAYFADNTPQSVIDFAIAELGSNVFIFSDVINQERDNLIRLPIVRDNIDF